MKIIADLHIHSKYSRATSKDGVPEFLDLWARKKGIGLLGTGDFTHPAWRQELKDKLIPAEDGLYRLKDEFLAEGAGAFDGDAPRFVLSGEISSIYKKNGKVRKVHNVILLPSLEAAELLSHKLEAIGNIHSDGRPILGLDSRDLLEITLETCPDAVFIPAHIWTPHFSLFGAFSGFDTIEECFEDLTPHIHALETGLSSDPPMNWRISALDRFALVSNSDAHSPQKLGREANLMDIERSYQGMAEALQGKNPKGLVGTIEFFPEEGKYHYDGHRNCGLCLKPTETEAYGGKCPVCGKKLTIGVEHRVEQLADREEGFVLPDGRPFESLVPLPEVIGASTGMSAAGKKVNAQYEAMLEQLGSEFYILREAPFEDIRHAAGPCIEEGIKRLREGRVERTPGYDGEYGKIGLLDKAEIDALSGQIRLFGAPVKKKAAASKAKSLKKNPAAEGLPANPSFSEATEKKSALSGLNEHQREAAATDEPSVAVVAGPGTGKTKTLIARIACLIEEKGVEPSSITAVTFTNKAAGEMRERLMAYFQNKRIVNAMTIGTFHSICLHLLEKKDKNVTLIGEYEALDTAAQVIRSLDLKISPKQFLSEVSKLKCGGQSDSLSEEAAEVYETRLKKMGVLDFDDLLLQILDEWETGSAGKRWEKAFSYLLVDEFQDVSDIQYRLVQAWSKQGKGLFVIGDPDQSIYGFRGSDAKCFERLLKDLPATRRIRLTENYRSTPEILNCALSAISKNEGEERVLHPNLEDGEPVQLMTAETPLSEGIFVAKEINRLVGGVDMLDSQAFSTGRGAEQPRSFSDIAVLYRTHRQAEIIEKCLRKESIPYVVVGRDDFLADLKVRGTEAFFRFLLEPRDISALRAALTMAFQFPEDLIVRLEQLFLAQKIADLSSDRAEAIFEEYSEVGHCRKWIELIRKYLPRVQKDKPRSLLEDWVAAMEWDGYEPLERFMNMSVFHPNMATFLSNLLLGEEGDLSRSAQPSYTTDFVRLMTLHGSKGLEFPVVFLCGVKKGSIPLESVSHPTDFSEERRLFYVGMTRAKEKLYLLTSSSEPSVFLQDLPEASLQKAPVTERKFQFEGKQLSLF